MERVRLLISGRVQGVWYRVSTQREARRLGLVGWVRNLGDGRVEAVAEGDRDALDVLASWCRRGPELASVTRVDAEWTAASGEWSDFAVRPTG